MTAERVLIINGPIASGKSTVAEALAAESRTSGSTAAVVGLDLVYAMLQQAALMSDPHISRLARRAAAARVEQYVLDGFQMVIVEGDFWTLDNGSHRVSLRCCHAARGHRGSVRRVQLDTSRGLSQIPEFLRSSHLAPKGVS